MAITGVAGSPVSANYDKLKAQRADGTPKTAAEIKAEEEKAAQEKKDGFGQSQSTDTTSVTYKKPTRASAQQLQQLEHARTESFTQMLRSMVAKQGERGNLSMFGMNLNVSQADSAAAAASIAPGGAYSVDAVAGRIMDMAKALSGGDPEKIETLRTAVQKGFKAAGVDMGGKLPSISNDTYNEVMSRFDAWKNGEE